MENNNPHISDTSDNSVSKHIIEPEREIIIDQILLNLKIIANIKEYDKIATTDKNVEIDKPAFLQGLKRALRGDSRQTTVFKINEIVEQAFAVTDEILSEECNEEINNSNGTKQLAFKEDNSHLFHRFTIELSNACRGLENLKITYKDDIPISSKIDLLIDKIQMRVDKINKLMFIKVN